MYTTDSSLHYVTADGHASEQEGPGGETDKLPRQHHGQGGRGAEEEGDEGGREEAGQQR